MERTYQIYKSLSGEGIVGIDKDGTTHGIPQDPANSDYQDYLAWIAKGNEAPISE
jgi:hypothetical protein